MRTVYPLTVVGGSGGGDGLVNGATLAPSSTLPSFTGDRRHLGKDSTSTASIASTAVDRHFPHHPHKPHPQHYQQHGGEQDNAFSDDFHGEASAPSLDRLWRRFSILALDAPSTAELRTVFARACSDVFGGDGPVSSALGRQRSNSTTFFSSQTWETMDTLGGIAAEYLYRLQRSLREIGNARTGNGGVGKGGRGTTMSGRGLGSCDEHAEATASHSAAASGRLDYYALARILRPLVLARAGGVSTPASVLQLWSHEVNVS